MVIRRDRFSDMQRRPKMKVLLFANGRSKSGHDAAAGPSIAPIVPTSSVLTVARSTPTNSVSRRRQSSAIWTSLDEGQIAQIRGGRCRNNPLPDGKERKLISNWRCSGASNRGASSICILGALGGRFDQDAGKYLFAGAAGIRRHPD